MEPLEPASSVREPSEGQPASPPREALLKSEIEGRRAAAFLAEASKILVSTLDYEDALAKVARLALPYLGDWCAVDELRPDGTVRRLATVTHHPDRQPLVDQMVSWEPEPCGPDGIPRALGTGHTVVALDDPELPQLGACVPHQQKLLRAAGMRSFMAVPLTARGKTVGAITFVSATDPFRYGEPEVRIAEDLAQRAALAVDNARLYREAQEAIRIREEFLSIASHEMYTPITSLLLVVESLRRNLEHGSTEASAQLKRSLAIAERQGRRLAMLVRSLLDVSRIQGGRLVLDLDGVELGALVREVTGHLAADLAHAGCELELELDAGIEGRWDRLRLEQVVTNLISNALKYGAGKPVTVAVRRSATHARLEVRDRGIGIPPEAQAKLFSPFERAVSFRQYGGLGLGLFICRRIVEAHGGTIGVRSAPGQGATFTVELPLLLPQPVH
jgi:signal transduction histidine kinase